MQETTLAPIYSEMLKSIIGNWSVDAAITLPDGSSATGTGRWYATEVSMGMGVHTLMRLEVEGRPKEENSLWGYDPGGQRLHMLSITSDGTVRDHSGALDENGVLHLRWDGIVGGEPASEEITMDLRSPDRVEIVSVESVGGEEQVWMEIVLRRR